MELGELIRVGETESWMEDTPPFDGPPVGGPPTSLLADLHVSSDPILVFIVR